MGPGAGAPWIQIQGIVKGILSTFKVFGEKQGLPR